MNHSTCTPDLCSIGTFIDDNFPPMFKQLMNKEAVVTYLQGKMQDGNAIEQLFIDILPKNKAKENADKMPDPFASEIRCHLLVLSNELEKELKKEEKELADNADTYWTWHEIVLTPEITAADLRFFTGEAIHSLAGNIGVDRYDGKNRTINRIVAYVKKLNQPIHALLECCFSRIINVREMTVADMLFTLSEEQLQAAAAVILPQNKIDSATHVKDLANLIKEANTNIGI